MKQLVQYDMADGTEVVVETNLSEGQAIQVARADGVIAKAQGTFEDALDKIKPAARALIEKIRSIEVAPDEVEIEFGIKLAVEAGAILASTSGEANYKVTMKWTKAPKT